MTDKVIRVNVTSSKSQKVTVSSSKVANEITASPDTSAYYSRLAKNWAIADGLVENIGYSSKHYAQESKASADMAKTYETATQENYNMFMESSFNANSELQTNRDGALADIEGAKTSAIDSLNSIKDENISTIESKANEEIENLNKEIEQGKDEIKDTIDGIKVLTTLKIGQIGIAPLGIDETLNMERYLNGQIIIQDQFKGFTKFLKRRIELYPSLACTEDEWQTTVTMSAFSQCGKFVIDDNARTIRLPKVVNIQGLTDLSKLGEIVEAGLPTHTHTRGTMNITGQTDGGFSKWNASGAFYNTGQTHDSFGSGASGFNIQNFDASRSWTGSTSTGNYSKALATTNTVQQEQIQYPYFIQVATGSETEDNIINEIELNNPFSLLDYKYSEYELNNLSWLRSNGQYNSKITYPAVYDLLLKIYNGAETKAGVSVKLSTETYGDYDFVLNTTDETFRLPLLNGSENLPSNRYIDLTLGASDDTYTAPTNGWVYIDKYAGGTPRYVNLIATVVSEQMSSFDNMRLKCFIPVKKGQIFRCSYNATGATNIFRLYYAQGNGSLYFYVGETVQNANLINAGRIEEKFASLGGKVASLIPDNKSLIGSYAMPSNKVINLTLGASGSTYTAPANGWMQCACTGTAGSTYFEIVTEYASATASFTGGWGRASIPVRKGAVVSVFYGGNNFTKQIFRFTYAEGEV